MSRMSARSASAISMPPRVAALPRNKARYPVPWFVATVGGEPDFRVIRPGGIETALRYKLCWVCGMPFLRQEDRAFVIGPMCAVNRVSAEPPSHRDCAVYSARACPFLSTPQMTRRERGMPQDAKVPAGISITRNPGVALVWVTGYRSWTTFGDGAGGTLFNIGEPKQALWYARGRDATRAEVMKSINTGLPLLLAMAEEDGPDAVAQLDAMRRKAIAYLPAEAVAP